MGDIIGGLISGGMSKSAGKRESSTIMGGVDRAEGVLEGFTDPGRQSTSSIMEALGQSGPEGQDKQFQNFLKSTGFQSEVRGGAAGIASNMAAKGLLNSGATLKGITRFGQDLAQRGFQNFMGNLGDVASRGAATGQAQANIISRGTQAAAGARRSGDEGMASGVGDAFEGVLGFF